jgi:monofunctional biosynthetic peptidoglycan transglycosylase
LRDARRLRRWIGWSLLAGLILSAGLLTALRWIPPASSSVMIQRILAGKPVHYRWVPLSDVAPVMALAVVAAEDQKFPAHHGFDFEAIRDAVDEGAEGRRLRGASTLSQQVAKNLFLWEGRSWVRKGLEAWLTALLELLWPKDRILEVYLNVAEMGDGVFGVGEASRRHFGRDPGSLSTEQAALLAATLPNPRRYSASAPSPYVRERQRWVLRQMDQLGGRSYLKGILPP